MRTYVQKYEIENILDLIDEATSDPYVLPNGISLSNLTVEKIRASVSPSMCTCKEACTRTELSIK